MSKAFLREDSSDDADDLPPPVSPVPPGTKNYLTAAGADRLRAELQQLLELPRPPAAELAADPAARAELRTRDLRIRYLENSLRTAVVAASDNLTESTVRFGSVVGVREPDGAEVSYQLVGVDEADPAAGRISWLSPLARSLLQARVGERVALRTPAGARELTILRIDPA